MNSRRATTSSKDLRRTSFLQLQLFDSQTCVPPDFPDDWASVLGEQFTNAEFANLQQFIREERLRSDVFPAPDEVYRAFQLTPLDRVKVVLLGQDPYPTPGHAHGLCFSVRPGVPLPASLRNIFKELHADLGIPPSRHGSLEAWARRGVLLLNTVLTVRSGEPGSHAHRGWEKFTDAVLNAIISRPVPAVFVLWGAQAQKKKPLIDPARHRIIESAHPSPLSASRGFLGSRPFSKVNAALESLGHAPVDWTLPEIT